jgi:hypothetical protein
MQGHSAVRASVVVAMIAIAGSSLACESAASREQRQRVESRLQVLEEAIPTQVPPGTTTADVRRFLEARGVKYEPNPMPGELIAYVGEWKGPFFQRGIHLIFYFDQQGKLVRHESKEVEGS